MFNFLDIFHYRPRAYRLHDLCYYIFDHMYKDSEFFGFEIADSRTDLWFRFFMSWNSLFKSAPHDYMCWERFERVN